MLLVRRYTLLAAIALCVPVSVRAQPAPTETGLLLGMSDGRTYWIPRDSTGFRLGTTVNQLVVPRADAGTRTPVQRGTGEGEWRHDRGVARRQLRYREHGLCGRDGGGDLPAPSHAVATR